MAQGIVGFQCIHFLPYRGWWNQGVCERCTELPNIRYLQKSCHIPPWKVPAFWTVTLFLRFLESFYPHWQFLQRVIPKKKKIELSTELGLLRLKKARCCPGESERRSGSSMKPDKRRQTPLTDWACVLFFSRAFVPTSIPLSSRISHTHSINSSKKPAGRFWSILGLKD